MAAGDFIPLSRGKSNTMNSTEPLTGTHLRTYNTIFQHPVSHNLEWRAVHSMFGKLGQIVEEPNGNFKVTRNGQILVLHPPRTKDVAEIEEVMSLRHFLERSGVVRPAPAAGGIHWLLVIDHHEARIFRSEAVGSIPQTILPHEPAAYFRHARHSKDFARGQEKPDPNSYFEPVAKALGESGPILIFGSGTGMSSEMEQFRAWLEIQRKDMAGRVVGTVVIDENHTTDRQLFAKAREFYVKAGRS
jgi:hypothetical protein